MPAEILFPLIALVCFWLYLWRNHRRRAPKKPPRIIRIGYLDVPGGDILITYDSGLRLYGDGTTWYYWGTKERIGTVCDLEVTQAVREFRIQQLEKRLTA